ncbi:MAG: ADP-glyceromanno-heptose 6-epimerase [Bacteroidetes bacterium]|nr:ADP-glyceromanno-heptose 6-epimerase [Bacteroidota bacterium]
MEKDSAIAITGAAGFIASYLTGYLNSLGFERLILVDDFSKEAKAPNLAGKKFIQKIHRDEFADWLQAHPGSVQHLFHLGARTDTTEMDYEVHRLLNLEYSKSIWACCTAQQIPLVYASSAATYGGGEHGYDDRHDTVPLLRPLNPYGQSKQDFDLWVLQQNTQPPFWAGLKFFNVYGPNEYHKGRMASVILHAHKQIKETGRARLFRSHNPAFTDGGQMRDFVYVKDVVHMCYWLMETRPSSGLYNIGSGKARSFLDLMKALFQALNLPAQIDFIDTPPDIRGKYQYFTEANMQKIRDAGYTRPFYSLETGVREYVSDFLESGRYY